MTFILRYTNVLIIIMIIIIIIIGRPFALSFCPVCNVGVLWPSAWTDRDKTWHTLCYMGTQLPLPKGVQHPSFRPLSIVAKRSPISAIAELLLLLLPLYSFPSLSFWFLHQAHGSQWRTVGTDRH